MQKTCREEIVIRFEYKLLFMVFTYHRHRMKNWQPVIDTQNKCVGI